MQETVEEVGWEQNKRYKTEREREEEEIVCFEFYVCWGPRDVNMMIVERVGAWVSPLRPWKVYSLCFITAPDVECGSDACESSQKSRHSNK